MKKSVVISLFAATVAAVTLSVPAHAAVTQFTVPLAAAQETTGGQTNGAGTVTLLVDNVANTITGTPSFNSFVTTPVTGFHIHQGAVGVNGSIVIDLVPLLTGGTATSTSSTISSLLANPTGFYVNAHNGSFPGGAVRGQMAAGAVVPEAGTLSLAFGAASLLGMVVARRRKAA